MFYYELDVHLVIMVVQKQILVSCKIIVYMFVAHIEKYIPVSCTSIVPTFMFVRTLQDISTK